MPSHDLQSARIVAGSLALLAREIREIGRPLDLWCPTLSPSFISDMAAKVGRGEATPLWAEEHHPARGLAIFSPSPQESAFFGFAVARLSGPYMMVENQTERERRVRKLARLAIEKGQSTASSLITLKTFHDPATLRGFLAENFVLAEIGTSLTAKIPEEQSPVACPAGFVILDQDELNSQNMAAEVALGLGDFFYDGHYRHDPRPGEQMAASLWQQTAIDDIQGQAQLALSLWDKKKDRPVALATTKISPPHAFLSILAVTPPYRGRNFGQLIMRETINRLSAQGQVTTIKVETASYNLPALTLYHRLGFFNTAPKVALHYHFAP
ncbi:MAG: GNAT family N-acetyltransferase [Candidatus Adiutrix sp.]